MAHREKVAPAIGAIHGMFFLSGMGALVFENVWFSQTGLIVGNSVWSAALVIGAFMAGLALGNGLAMVLARRWGNLVRGYAKVELVAALSGALLVLAFPWLPGVFRPFLATFVDQAPVLNLARTAIAFGLMVIPATALGATLPLLSRPLESATGSYGVALGRLYGVNTLGAVAGTLLAELALIPGLGLRGSGLLAAACNLAAAYIALRVAQHPLFEVAPSPAQATRAPLSMDGSRILAAAFLAGGILLALEVVWFRFLLLFQNGTTLIFTTMLAVVLSGIGLGGVLASRLSRRGGLSAGVTRLAAATAAAGVVAGYAAFDGFLQAMVPMRVGSIYPAVLLSVVLMGPVCLLSGVLFTALGEQLRMRIADAAATTGVLTLANTVGAVAGSLLAAFIVLPLLGVERSFFVLAALYGLIVLIVPSGEAAPWRRAAPVLAAVLALALFPFGRMVDSHYREVEARYGARLIAAREGMVETAFYLQHEFLGEPLFERLATNSFSMSATAIRSHRYMKLFAYVPAALHPGIESALLICFGVGSTASALADLPEVKHIDVVDVSRDVLEMSDLVFPDPRSHPLRDRRVAIHVEDGRFFLQQTGRRYDLITGEPPPPKIAGVTSLYTLEYFRLLRDRLNPGGLATYWLPVHQLRESDALAIIRAFCDAFDDCSLWSGIGLEWMMVGSRGGIAPVSRERFSRLWTDPRTERELRSIGIDRPERMVALFMADAAVLRKVTARTAPLEDNYPRRVSSRLPSGRAESLFAWLMDAGRSRERLVSSPWIAGILPQALIAASATHFRERGMLDAAMHPELRKRNSSLWSDLAELLGGTDPATLPLWMLDSEARMVEIAANKDAADPAAAEQQAIDALVKRRPPEADVVQERFRTMAPKGQLVTVFRHCLAGNQAYARSLMAWIPEERRAAEPYRGFLSWAAAACAAD